jgi:hypothetical protein
MTKEEYAQLGLQDGRRVSFHIRQYRRLSQHDSKLGAEVPMVYDVPPTIGENI